MGAAARIPPPPTSPRLAFVVAPLCFNREDAKRYTGISEKLFADLERAGSLTGRAIGRNGEVMFHRAQLDTVTARLFGAGGTDIDSEFEGIGGED